MSQKKLKEKDKREKNPSFEDWERKNSNCSHKPLSKFKNFYKGFFIIPYHHEKSQTPMIKLEFGIYILL